MQWSKAVTLVANSALTLSIPKISDVVGLFGEGDDGLADPTLQGFRDGFDELMAELDEIDRVVVLVDDLDCCLPDTVVAALEVGNHRFQGGQAAMDVRDNRDRQALERPSGRS